MSLSAFHPGKETGRIRLMLQIGLRYKKAVFVDFFDTVVFRRVHSSQVIPRWAAAMIRKFPELGGFGEGRLLRERDGAYRALNGRFEEVPYDAAMRGLYEKLPSDFQGKYAADCFVQTSLNIEISVELGCQFANRRMCRFLRTQKARGKMLVCVSDFYLPGGAYRLFLKNLGLEGLFDHLFVSADCNRTKRKGSLYPYVLERLSLRASDVFMIGDSRVSDQRNAEKYGIRAHRYLPFFHKVLMRIRKHGRMDYKKRMLPRILRECRHRTLFAEYAAPFYCFTDRLYGELKTRNATKAAFISREGLYLKKLFDVYQELRVPQNGTIESLYLKNSRKVNRDALRAFQNGEADADKVRIFQKYVNSFVSGRRLFLVDVGWNNSAQEIIGKLCGLETYGFYIGTFRKDRLDYQCERKGLLYDISESGQYSDFYWIYRANCTLYEQLLAAPHGSVVGYAEKPDGTVEPQEEWEPRERFVYTQYLESIQEVILLKFRGLCAWMDGEIPERLLADNMLSSGLFGSKKRMELLNELDRNYYDNLTCGKESKIHSHREMGFNFLEFIRHPDTYVHYVCKLQRKLAGYPAASLLYWPLAGAFAGYVQLFGYPRSRLEG